MRLPWKNIAYHTLAIIMSAIVLFYTTVMIIGYITCKEYCLGTIYWWEDAIEMPAFAVLAVTTIVMALENIMREIDNTYNKTR